LSGNGLIPKMSGGVGYLERPGCRRGKVDGGFRALGLVTGKDWHEGRCV
jgi:hypothetical protein